jgi:hypothetical protein
MPNRDSDRNATNSPRPPDKPLSISVEALLALFAAVTQMTAVVDTFIAQPQ